MLKMVPSYYFISKKTGIIFGKRQKILIFMKHSRNQENKQSIVQTNKPLPEIRDDMDSRSNKEGNKNSVGNSKKQGNTEPKK